MLMLQAYCDESHDVRHIGGKLHGRVFCVAGYLAEGEKWIAFSKAWDKALVEEGVPEFHMADCVAGEGSIFGNMDEQRREALQKRFIGIITRVGLFGYASGIMLDRYHELQPRIKQLRRVAPGHRVSGSLDDPYFLAFQAVIEHVATDKGIAALPLEEKVAFTFDKNATNAGRAIALYESLCARTDVDYRVRLRGRVSFGDRRIITPLQAADILAYESYRHLSERGRLPERWQFAQLKKRLTGRMFDGPELDKLLRALEEQFVAMPAVPPSLRSSSIPTWKKWLRAIRGLPVRVRRTLRRWFN